MAKKYDDEIEYKDRKRDKENAKEKIRQARKNKGKIRESEQGE